MDGITTIGVLHPGEMGSVVGAAARANELRVLWASDGRGAQTAARAAGAGLEDVKTLPPLIAASQVILSICPPHAAVDLARLVMARPFSGIYIDGNAVSPATGREIGKIVTDAGATFVDGGIIGPPPVKPGTTRLYLSGAEASRVAGLFAKGPLEAIAIDGGPGAASALKMAYAAYTKGTSALLMGIRALAAQAGVDRPLQDEWARSQPGVGSRSESAARDSARKAWRFTGEMAEIAASFEDAGLPGGFFVAAGEIYERLAAYKDAAEPPSLEEVLSVLRGRRRT
jgi:3-hydroxyisobutyrate dehydrogenase-like beta-hydroxyacid dehydrogenase